MAQPTFDVREQLDEGLSFFSEADSTLPGSLPGAYADFDGDSPYALTAEGSLCLQCDAGNPGEIYGSIANQCIT